MILDLEIKNIIPTLFTVRNEYLKIKNSLPEHFEGSKKVDEKRFINDFNIFIEEHKERKAVTEATIKTYTTTLNKLKEFQKEKNFNIYYDNIDEKFYYKFLNYLRDDKNLFDNTIDKHIKNIKLFMSYALKLKYHNNNEYLTFKRTRAKADFTFLEFDEIRKLYYDYKPSPKNYEYIRDAFILGCSTGLRFQDLIKLTKSSFYIVRDKITNKILSDASNSYIKVKTQKTQELVRIPFNNVICDFVEKYDIENKEIEFVKQNNQVFNREIKKICREAGITKSIEISKKKGKIDVITTKDKCDFISSHTMRHTFITLLSSLTEASNIQAVSGHKDIKVLNEYIKRNDYELNSVSGAFNTIFYPKDENKNTEKPQKIKFHLKGTKVISGK